MHPLIIIKFLFCLILLLYTKSTSAQAYYGFSIDEKFSVHKNRIGISGFRQGKKHGKIGITFIYNYSKYKYPSYIVHLNNSGTGYILSSQYTPPYEGVLGKDIRSVMTGYGIDIYNSYRLKTFKKSNLDLKIAIGLNRLQDNYSSNYFGEETKNSLIFNEILCNMYITYLVWFRNLGLEIIAGPAYYYPIITGNKYYQSKSPFVGTEIELGISLYFQKNKKHQH